MGHLRSLLVFYSRTGNAKFVAEKVALYLARKLKEVVDLENRRGLLGFTRAGYAAKWDKTTKIEKLAAIT